MSLSSVHKKINIIIHNNIVIIYIIDMFLVYRYRTVKHPPTISTTF